MKIAIIGTGISGLSSAYLLHPHHEITVYESNAYIGGHSRTITVATPEGQIPVDTGFIVYNERNYPLLTGLFKHLNVPIAKSRMSFGVSINDGWLEYSSQGLLAQYANICRPNFWRMIRDILTFNRHALREVRKNPDLSLGQFLDHMKLGAWFKHYYLQAMGAAIWSCSVKTILDFPAQTFLRFFENHGLLTINDHPQWYTVQGGSREYVSRLTAGFQDRIYLNRGVVSVRRDEGGVYVTDVGGMTERYDYAVMASHANQTLNMMADPSDQEREILSAFTYQENHVVVHRDISFMPKRKGCWASWMYLSQSRQDHAPVLSLSYWMNNLQPLQTSVPILVTLNPGREPEPGLIYDRYTFEHPIFDKRAVRAQAHIEGIQGKNRLYFCGAYQRYGFHEDGLLSAVQAVKKLGVEVPW
ncbi:MAG: FAD-dependent oxidoreductase [Alphaproteobacteria bacterium]|nr:FAD-dependent oxidoreductase [Alphaproteobacteria bacterium]